MKIPYIVNESGWTFFNEGVPIKITQDDPRYEDVLKAVMANDDDLILSIIETSPAPYILKTFKNFNGLKFLEVQKDGKLTYDASYRSFELPDVLKQKLISLYQSGCTDFTCFINFIDNLIANPSEESRKELYDFLSYAELPITPEGMFIAYKGIATDGYSINGNTETRVISGKVDNRGRIQNNVGDVIEVFVADVDNNRNNQCSCGLHVGSYDYAKGFGAVVVAVEVNPKDVISVPKDYNCQKARVSRYKVLNVVKTFYESPDVVVEEDNTVTECNKNRKPRNTMGVESENVIKQLTTPSNMLHKTRHAIERQINNHMINDKGKAVRRTNAKLANEATTISQLCGSVGRKLKVNSATMLSLCLKLGYNIDTTPNSISNYIITL